MQVLTRTSRIISLRTHHRAFAVSRATSRPIDHYAVTFSVASATAGVVFVFTVTAQDVSNNTANGYTGTVTFSSSDTQATLPANATLTAGVATFSATLKTAGTKTLTATDTTTATITGVSSGVTVA